MGQHVPDIHAPSGGGMMVASVEPNTITIRINQEAEERFRGLLAEAEACDMKAEPDCVHTGRCIVWTPGLRGSCELVSIEGCSCQRFRTWHRCPHHALVIHRLGIVIAADTAA